MTYRRVQLGTTWYRMYDRQKASTDYTLRCLEEEEVNTLDNYIYRRTGYKSINKLN